MEWTSDDDMKLAETVLRHIRQGSTRDKGFKETGQAIGRTRDACMYRWNNIVCHKYQAAIEIAKQQRVRKVKKSKPKPEEKKMSLLDIVSRIKQIDEENKQLQLKMEEQKKELEVFRKKDESYDQIKRDYQDLLSIIDRARKLAFLSDVEVEDKPKFKIDKEGNVERLD